VAAPDSPPASVSGFSPASGIAGSTTVTITGTNLAGASAVKFNGVMAAFSSDTATSIKAIVPNGATSGKVSVTTPGGTASSSSSFDVTFTLASFAPASGPYGTDVTIIGNGFTSTANGEVRRLPGDRREPNAAEQAGRGRARERDQRADHGHEHSRAGWDRD
jgi:hypothetical protein